MADEENTSSPSSVQTTSETDPKGFNRGVEGQQEERQTEEHPGAKNKGSDGKKNVEDEAKGLDNIKEAVNCHKQLETALKPYKIEVQRDAAGKPILKDGKLQGTVMKDGKPVEDPAEKENLLKAQLLKDAIKGKMQTKEGQEYFMQSSLGDLVGEMADAGFNVKDGLDGGMLSMLVKTVAEMTKKFDVFDRDSEVRNSFRAGQDPNSTLGQKLGGGIKSDYEDMAKAQMGFAKKYTGAKGCKEVYEMADRISKGGHATKENANAPTVRQGPGQSYSPTPVSPGKPAPSRSTGLINP